MNKRFFIVRLGTVFVLSLVLCATQPALTHPALAAADSPIYADALAGGWQDWSWDTTRNFDNAQPVHSGSASIAVTYTAAWGGLYLHTDTALPVSDYIAIRFWVHGGSIGGQSVDFSLNDGGGSYPFTVQANTWLPVTVPLAALGNPTTLSDLKWQDGSGNGLGQPTFYLDDISLIGTLQVYTDALTGGWQDWSWDTTRSFDNAQPVHSGSASIAVTYTAAWAGLYLHTDTALPASDYTAIRFWVHGGSTGGQLVYFNINGGGGYAFTVQANTWLSVTVPLAALGNPTTLSDLKWQDNSGNGQPTFYLDDISLIGRPSIIFLPAIFNDYCASQYFDDFSTQTGRWWVDDNADRTLGYVDEEYQILLKNTNSGWLQTPDLVLPNNYRIEVDAYQPSSDRYSHGLSFGIRWNGGDWESYQFIVYPPSQEYLLEKNYMNGTWVTVIDWTGSAAIHLDTPNHLRVDRVGTLIRLYINGVQVNTATDASFTGTGRDAGVRVYSGNSAPVDTRFDNFSATCLP